MFKIRTTPGDKAFSLFIRYKANWSCERCRKQFPERSGKLDNSHFWGRGNRGTRHDEENCAALCKRCHWYFSANPDEHREFFFKRLGQKRYDALRVRACAASQYRVDDSIVALGFRERLKKMGVLMKKGPALLSPASILR